MPNENASTVPLVAHSYTEIHLFLQVTICEACAAGPLQPLSPTLPPLTPATSLITLSTTCLHCQHPRNFTFELPRDAAPVKKHELAHINLTPQPSQLIDLAQWLTLDQMLNESFSRESDVKLSRRTAIRASLCLGEALKFFDDPDNDLPPTQAFFHDSTRSRFTQSPQLYSRQRILALLSQRPLATASELPQNGS